MIRTTILIYVCTVCYVCLTLIGMARLWFHCGLAFFSRILVQTWKIKENAIQIKWIGYVFNVGFGIKMFR